MSKLSSSEYGGYPSNFSPICDKCQSAPCNICCLTDSAPLCTSSEYIHAPANPMTFCTLCNNAPVNFEVMDDMAFLCTNCYFQMHSTNTLEHCHNQVLTPPISSLADGSSTTYMNSEIIAHKADKGIENQTDSWLLLSPRNEDNLSNDGFMFGGELDECFDLIEYNACMNYEFQDHYNQQQQSYNVQEDIVVPIHSMEAADRRQQYQAEPKQSFHLDTQHEIPKSAFKNTLSSSQTAPMLYMHGSYSPKATAINSSTIGMSDLVVNPPPLTPSQISKINRKAKVLKYIEKRKKRKVVKKVRYASRKAYAQIRPRVKGRFSRKTDLESDIS